MCSSKSRQLDILCDHLAARRESILDAWRRLSRADPEQTTARGLTRKQFLDHIPQMLDAFEIKLRAGAASAPNPVAAAEKKDEEVKHGLHRWQQGYRMEELIKECGHLQLCLFDELDRIASANPELERETLFEANRQVVTLINDAVRESAVQYERMQQAEAASRVGDLRDALAGIQEIELRRAALIHQAVHDLGNDVAGVRIAAKLLGRTGLADEQRAESAVLLQRGVQGLTTMLGDLLELARLEAGQECRKIITFDAPRLIAEVVALNQPLARERGLYLTAEGTPDFSVEGDADKVKRVLQNLLTNALKYTLSGGVTVSWGKETANWWLGVKDTGPGLDHGAATSLVAGLNEATASAKEAEAGSAPPSHATATRAPSVPVVPPPSTEPTHKAGEGIGLSIVKRLCELLDASLEVTSSAEDGTVWRILFPRRYET